jgi:hypothetical protein
LGVTGSAGVLASQGLAGDGAALLAILGMVFQVVLGVLAIIAVVVALRFLKQTRAARTFAMFNDLWKEYQSPEMLKALRRLHDFYDECGHNEDNLVSAYKRLYWSVHSEGPTLHYYRRYVSHFFQKAASLIAQGLLDSRTFYGSWNRGDLRVIPEILVPVESRALPSLWGEAEFPKDAIPKRLRILLDLYTNAPDD